MNHDGTVDNERNRYRSLSWDNAIHTFATSYIFQQRARNLKRQLLWVNYLGIALPLVMGTLVLTFGVVDPLKKVAIVIGALLIPQVVINAWAVLGSWVERHSYANTSAAANDSLSTRFHELGANPPPNLDELKHAYDKLQIEDKARRDQDMQYDITEPEKRMGMRAALRKFQRPCASCKLAPTAMRPSNCDVCGKFKYSE